MMTIYYTIIGVKCILQVRELCFSEIRLKEICFFLFISFYIKMKI